jgi:hypothetical protein
VAVILPKFGGGAAGSKQSFYGGIQGLDEEIDDKVRLIDDQGAVFVNYISGTIEVDEKDRLKKLLFRATRGKVLTVF